MVAKKIKSKRLTTRHRVKVTRKVSEHRRKMRKGAAHPHKAGSKNKKDPGIPKEMPQRDEFIERLKQDRELEREQKKVSRLLAQQRKQQAIDIVPEDGSKRAYFRELRKVIEASDVVLEILDARDPQGYRVKDVEQQVLQAGKRIIVVLNKADLVPSAVVDGWMRSIQREFPCVAFTSSSSRDKAAAGGTEHQQPAKGADDLLQLLKNYCRNQNIKTSIAVGVIGYPNVGKSSIINSLKRARVCRVGATPGVTTVGQEVHLDRNIRLIDCPGIVFDDTRSDASVLLRNCIRVENMPDPIEPVRLIVSQCSAEYLMQLYTIPSFGSVEDFLQEVGRRQGKLRKGGIVDVMAAARAILHDWNEGKIAYYVPPPTTVNDAATIVASAWAPEFSLAGMTDVDAVQMITPSEAPVSAVVSAQMVIGIPATPNSNDLPKSTLRMTKKTAEASTVPLNSYEQSLNPQTNRQRVQSLKKQRKQREKAERKATVSTSSEDEGHGFGPFKPLPGN